MKHLRRLDQVFRTPPIYFITICVAERKRCLDTSENHQIPIHEFVISQKKYGWRVDEYVVMPDHIHFLCWQSEEKVSLSGFIGKWKEWSSKALIRNLPEFRWQAEFFDHLFRSEKSLAEKRDYMKMNPVRAGLVEGIQSWPYRGTISEI